MKIETQCLHEGYKPENGGPSALPIVQSTTYRFDSTAKIASLFDMPTEFMYSRFANPTCDAVEKKIAALEGGVGAYADLVRSGSFPAVYPEPVLGWRQLHRGVHHLRRHHQPVRCYA